MSPVAVDHQVPAPPHFTDRPLWEYAANWHALYVRHQHEKAVAQHLQQLGCSVFLPLYNEIRQWSDRRRQISLPLFPCYVFFAGDIERRVRILSTPGVISLVLASGRAAAIPAAELETIRIAAGGPLPVLPHPFLRSGDRVRVCKGPLAGIEGVVSRFRDCTRIVLSVETLCRSVAVEVDEGLIERVIPATTAPIAR